ncbi:hypothetical protein LEM8419_02252 [Neolewinella maritima]|uniref:Protein-glutamine gamma-glutamyltransferase-like C-terminal domain-containing protein n=1 Tax=Neolewinella maritima TaxID=1383882 RepID=A0ABM9B2C3_9BACT|nr:hypothetical protein [Neolewinella maritima]CAH1001351.1 hypothetical protein LEM8419_02252 [Neolewinella maritima]
MRLLLPLLLLFYAPLGAQGGDGSDLFPATRHQELREELTYEPEEEVVEEPAAPVRFDFDLSSFRSPLVVGIALALVLGLGFLIYRILGDLAVKRRQQATPPTTGVTVQEIVEEELMQQGVSLSMLERAEAAGQYDIAVRLRYIDALKSLQDAGLIRYRRDYSNRDYREQLADHPLRTDFVRVVEAYERYWYGRYAIDRLSYRLVERDFRTLSEQIAVPTTTASHD